MVSNQLTILYCYCKNAILQTPMKWRLTSLHPNKPMDKNRIPVIRSNFEKKRSHRKVGCRIVLVEVYNRVFSKCTRMAIMPLLASEALLRENKKGQ